MVPYALFFDNLTLCQRHAVPGCVVECGVWRGGMSGAMADALPGRRHYLLDSFEGLPPAKAIDGERAIAWQAAVDSPIYFDNCRAEQAYAQKAMAMSRARSFELVAGWFDKTLPTFKPQEPIAVLRLDGDWYDSTLVCLQHLYPMVPVGGLIIIDDYHTWDGCTRAVHDYLSANQLRDRIRQSRRGVCYILKQ